MKTLHFFCTNVWGMCEKLLKQYYVLSCHATVSMGTSAVVAHLNFGLPLLDNIRYVVSDIYLFTKI